MRKKDYSWLAALLKIEIVGAKSQLLDNPHNTTQLERLDLARHIGVAFADQASVDKQAFLKACGIDT